MMKCQNCGAEYDAAMRACPYCGAENTELAQKELEDKLDRIHYQTKNLKNLPAQMVNRFTKRALKILPMILAVVLVGGLLIGTGKAIATYIDNKSEPARRQKHLEQLVTLADAGEYEALQEYMSKNQLYGGAYEEFRPLVYASYSFYFVDQCRECLEKGGIWRSTLGYTLMDASQEILEIDEALEKITFVYGADRALYAIRDDMMALLKEDLGLSEAEVEELFALCLETEDMENLEEKGKLFCEIGIKAVKRKGIHILEDDETLE